MAKAKAKTTQTEKLLSVIIDGIKEKKGFDITVINLQKLKNPFASYFVICSGNTDTQTTAICDSVEKMTKDVLQDRPLHVEGRQKGEWVLLDYVDIVVHIFIPRIRTFYQLEDLWADGEFTHIED